LESGSGHKAQGIRLKVEDVELSAIKKGGF